METITLESAGLKAVIKSLGAELVSFCRGGVEYLWQGNPEFWSGQSPLLFPNTGRYWNNVYRHAGKTYAQKAHGFARNMDFAVVDRSDSHVVFGLHSDDETLAVYPFPFFLFVTYRLDGCGLSVEWFVRNEGDSEMHFQIGAHPALNLPGYRADEEVHGYFSFEPEGTPEYLIPVENGCVDASSPLPLPLDAQGMMPITASTFNIDTYVIEAGALRSCTLCDASRKPWISVEFRMPVLALWAPTLKRPDCPFVCVEPWCGSCDTVGYAGELADRRHEQHLAPGAHFSTVYRLLPC